MGVPLYGQNVPIINFDYRFQDVQMNPFLKKSSSE